MNRDETVRSLKKAPEFLNGQAGIAHDATHREGIDWIVARDCKNAGAVSHHDVLALPSHSEPCFFECPNRNEVINPGYARHVSADFDFTNIRITDEFVAHKQIFLYRFPDIGNGVGLGNSLRPATRKTGDGDAVTFVSSLDSDLVFHVQNPPCLSIDPVLRPRQFLNALYV